MKPKTPKGWTWNGPHTLYCPGSCGFWQKRLDDTHFVQVIKWDFKNNPELRQPRYEVEFDCEVDGVTVRTKIFTYFKLNFKKFESEARRIIKVVER